MSDFPYQLPDGASHPTWVGGDVGHVSLKEARELAIVALAKCEAEYIEALEKFNARKAELDKVIGAKRRAEDTLAIKATKVRDAQARLALKCGLELKLDD